MAQSQSDKNRVQGGGSQILNPIAFKNFTPNELLPQGTTQSPVTNRLFFETARYEYTNATPQNGYGAYSVRTLPFISNAIFGNQY